MGDSGAELGEENVRLLTQYLNGLRESKRRLPEFRGRVNTTAVARQAGLNDRGILYQNPRCRALLTEAQEMIGLDTGYSDSDTPHKASAPDAELQRRLHTLEQENASLRAEVTDLRMRVKQYRHIEDVMVQTGRRVAR